MIRRVRGLPVRCWACWWREGRKCFSTIEALGGELDRKPYQRPDGTEADFQVNVGREITDEHFTACQEAGARRSKREVLEQVIPGPIIIESEENLRRLGELP